MVDERLLLMACSFCVACCGVTLAADPFEVNVALGKGVNTVEQGDEIAVEWTLNLVRKGGQVRTAEGCNTFEIKDNKIQRLRAYFNPSDF